MMLETIDSVLVFLVISAIRKNVATIDFRKTNMQVLESELHQFSFKQHMADDRQQIAEIVRLYDFITSQYDAAGFVDTKL